MKKIMLAALVFLLPLAACDIPEAHTSAPVAIEQSFPQSQWAQAKHTAWCESRYVFTAVNGDHWGIFQIWGGWAKELDPIFRYDGQGNRITFATKKFDPYWNSQYAWYIVQRYGWSKWQDVCV